MHMFTSDSQTYPLPYPACGMCKDCGKNAVDLTKVSMHYAAKTAGIPKMQKIRTVLDFHIDFFRLVRYNNIVEIGFQLYNSRFQFIII